MRELDFDTMHLFARVAQLGARSAATFVVKGKPAVIVAEGDFRSNDTHVVASMVLQGLGIGRLATMAAAPLLKSGRLVAVLETCVADQAVPIFAITQGGRHRLPKIKACLDWWAEWFGAIDAPASRKK